MTHLGVIPGMSTPNTPISGYGGTQKDPIMDPFGPHLGALNEVMYYTSLVSMYP